MSCQYDKPWEGKCSTDADGKYCKDHKGIECVSCGEQATHGCAETAQFVCGAPLCDNCEHTIRENGCNSGAPLPEGLKPHCKKGEQVYKPWFLSKETA